MSEQIIKIAENNVEVKTSKKITDINGIEFEVWESPKSYGQTLIDSELVRANKEFSDVNTLDEKTYKQELIDKAQAKLDRLVLIQTVMDS